MFPGMWPRTLSWQLHMCLQTCPLALSPLSVDQDHVTSQNHGGSHLLTTVQVKVKKVDVTGEELRDANKT